MDIDPNRPRLAAVVGWPISQSLSPVIHMEWARREGRAAYYAPIAVKPEYADFAAAIDHLRGLGFAGANVTLPHKEHALRYADAASDEAVEIGAANMLTFHGDNTHADNSDWFGFLEALKEAGRDGAGCSALVIGAGGAARAIVAALRRFGVSAIKIANRTKARAVPLLEAAGDEFVEFQYIDQHLGDADFIVNTTNLGMAGSPPLEINGDAFEKTSLVADIVYNPSPTPLLFAAKNRGCKTVDGLSMLMHQAAPGYRRWLGDHAEVDDALRGLLEARLARRGAP